MKRLLIVFLLGLLMASTLEAKCGNSIIYVNGVIAGAASDTTVSIQVTPDAKLGATTADYD